MSGSVVVEIMSTVPAEGVFLLLGNNWTIGKVMVELKVIMEPVTSAENEKIEEENPGVFLSFL